MRKINPPDMSDMFLAGLNVRRSAVLERAIDENPEVLPEEWWRILRSVAQPLSKLPQYH